MQAQHGVGHVNLRCNQNRCDGNQNRQNNGDSEHPMEAHRITAIEEAVDSTLSRCAPSIHVAIKQVGT